MAMKFGIAITIALTVTVCLSTVFACPQMQCAPIISKCQLIDACRCETNKNINYTCYLGCSRCLGDLFVDCCSCVGVCPKEDENDNTLESHVKMFREPTNADLFELFAADEDMSGRWLVQNIQLPPKSPSENSSEPAKYINCTVAYLSSCLDMYKCESSCMSMGASAYRWFHVGCCECLGSSCYNFGLTEIRCRNCPEESEQEIDSRVEPY